MIAIPWAPAYLFERATFTFGVARDPLYGVFTGLRLGRCPFCSFGPGSVNEFRRLAGLAELDSKKDGLGTGTVIWYGGVSEVAWVLFGVRVAIDG